MEDEERFLRRVSDGRETERECANGLCWNGSFKETGYKAQGIDLYEIFYASEWIPETNGMGKGKG